MFLLTEQIEKNVLKKYIKELYNFSIEKLSKIDRKPKVILKEDQQNADDIFGMTGRYDPAREEIVLYITDRHPKDVLRSLVHELVHHEQNCRGDTEKLDLSLTATDPAYASHDKGLREMEREAFERGNMIFRDWCDIKKVEKQNRRDKVIMSETKKVSKKIIIENDDKKNVKQEEKTPYEQIFQEKERLMKDRMENHETTLYNELMKRFIEEKK